jgi:hypothetical protein
MLTIALLVGATLTVGCGGGDEMDLSGGKDATSNSANKDNGDNADNSDNQGNGDESPDSGDDGQNSDSGGSSKDANDYASKVCKAISKYADDIEEMSNSDASFEDPEAMKDMMSQAVPVLEGISRDMDKVDPPSDVEDWHNGMVSTMSMAADLFDRMSQALDKPIEDAMTELEELSSEMGDMEDPFTSMTDLPAEYQTAFEENDDCKELQNLDFFE